VTDLAVPRVDAEARIVERIEMGQELLGSPIHSEADFDEIGEARSLWHRYNTELLLRLFTDELPSQEYSHIGPQIVFPKTVPQLVQDLHEDIERHLVRLRSLLSRLELFDEPRLGGAVTDASERTARGRSVFIVHGHAGREDAVARVVNEHPTLGLKAVILGEAPHGGSQTLIEKLERVAAPCGYAVVIYTGDDLGRAVDADGLEPRARENVVLELGYFIGRLGRSCVTVLHDPSVEFPTDFRGVGYHPLDAAGAWKSKLASELEVAYPAGD